MPPPALASTLSSLSVSCASCCGEHRLRLGEHLLEVGRLRHQVWAPRLRRKLLRVELVLESLDQSSSESGGAAARARRRRRRASRRRAAATSRSPRGSPCAITRGSRVLGLALMRTPTRATRASARRSPSARGRAASSAAREHRRVLLAQRVEHRGPQLAKPRASSTLRRPGAGASRLAPTATAVTVGGSRPPTCAAIAAAARRRRRPAAVPWRPPRGGRRRDGGRRPVLGRCDGARARARGAAARRGPRRRSPRHARGARPARARRRRGAPARPASSRSIRACSALRDGSSSGVGRLDERELELRAGVGAVLHRAQRGGDQLEQPHDARPRPTRRACSARRSSCSGVTRQLGRDLAEHLRDHQRRGRGPRGRRRSGRGRGPTRPAGRRRSSAARASPRGDRVDRAEQQVGVGGAEHRQHVVQHDRRAGVGDELLQRPERVAERARGRAGDQRATPRRGSRSTPRRPRGAAPRRSGRPSGARSRTGGSGRRPSAAPCWPRSWPARRSCAAAAPRAS